MTRLEPQAVRTRPVPQPAHRRFGVGRAVRTGLLLALGVLLVAIALIWIRLASFNDRVSTAGAASTSLLGGLTFGDEPVNVLIIGYGGEDHAGVYLSDSINIASLDPTTDTTTIIPVPRDLWVEGNPGIPNNGKVNQAFALGVSEGGFDEGGERAAEVVASVTGLEIPHWIAIDFTGFAAIVDAVGGITITNSVGFSYGGPDAGVTGEWDGTFATGELTLDGEGALYYARTRYTDTASESSDFARSVRQQRVLSAVSAKLTGAGPAGLPSIFNVMDAADEQIRTNMSVIDLGLFAMNSDPDRRLELAEDEILQASTTTDGQYVLVVIGRSGPSDYQPLQSFIRERLAEPPPSPLSSPLPGG